MSETAENVAEDEMCGQESGNTKSATLYISIIVHYGYGAIASSCEISIVWVIASLHLLCKAKLKRITSGTASYGPRALLHFCVSRITT